eukprot:TRINITY_DN10525_c0_g1_i1.p1 TRINITY_DN10525_c0_g1~~TRINITY_DN10525_c0_g1_i1.p1  ORF type:complete len:381 (+),score=50.46 TRINITY_DN10525_c0_g1_i1:83-1225(+)
MQAFNLSTRRYGSVRGYVTMPTFLRQPMAAKSPLEHANRRLEPYHPPAWMDAGRLSYNAPKSRIRFIATPTPLHPWNPFRIPASTSLYIKRDDMTHAVATGNKVRKLEFLLAEAIAQGATDVITCGGVQSNHCRATAILAREVGLKPHLLLRSDEKHVQELNITGNLFLDRMVDSELYLTAKQSPYEPVLREKMESIQGDIESKGRYAYAIPVGGSNITGLYGYLEAFAELHTQCQAVGATDIVVTCGSGGSLCGLGLANHLHNSPYRIWGVSICDDRHYFYQHIQQTLDLLELPLKSQELVTVIDGFKGEGYGQFDDVHVEFMQQVAARSGIVLDPTYTGKGTLALHTMLWAIQRLHGQKVVFVHTGGSFGLLDGRVAL